MEPEHPCALITGSSRGIGLQIAKRCSEGGYRVVLVARDEAKLAEAARGLRGPVATLAIDLRDPAAPERVLARCAERFGVPHLLVNNAGTAPSDKLENTGDAVLDEVLDLHVKAAFRLLRVLTPEWKRLQRGTAVQLASSAGLRGFPFTAAYTAAKHAMVGMTRALAAEWQGTPLRIGAICPGFVDTEITRAAAAKVAARGKQTAEQALARMGALNRIGRLHTADEVADAVWRFVVDPAFGHSGAIWDLDATPPKLA